MSVLLILSLTVFCFFQTGALHWLARACGWETPRRLGRKRFAASPTSEGGAAFLLGFLLCLAVSSRHLGEDLLLSLDEMQSHHWGLALGLLWIWSAGRWADLRKYPHAFTILVIAVGAAIATGFGFTVHTVRIGERVYDLGGFSIPATLLWFVVISEFFRLFDGLDGLLVMLVICALSLQLMVLSEEEGYARLLCQTTLPPLLGLLPWRVYPARIEIRGIGACLPGFIFGAVTMAGREKAFTTKAVLLPTLVLIAVLSLLVLWLLEQRLFLPKKKHG
jgi:UDP-N-acetylmuramyl pentapeptide phosphotransferase/UDP-N-acetylglucosamine-1-phosphate transferase